MNYVFFLFLFGFLGPQFGGQPYNTLEECEKERASVVTKIAEHNASAEPVKIIFYATTCEKVKQAPKGKDV